MTLLLKSTVRATNAVGNVHGNIGPSDFVAMLDFARDEYFTNLGGVRADYSLPDVVEVSRASQGPYVLRDGITRFAPANQPRRHFIGPLDTEGLLVFGHRSNFVTNASDGAAVTIPNASTSERVLLSWGGSGDVTLTAPELTLVDDRVEDGRKIRAYSRTTGSFPATLGIVGSVTEVQAETGTILNAASPFMGYGAAVAVETVKLRAPFKTLLAAGTGTVLARFVLAPGPVTSHAASLISVMSASPLGGIHAVCSRQFGTSGTDSVQTIPDSGSFGQQINHQHLSGTGRRAFAVGLRFTGFGDTADIISYGALGTSSGNGPRFGPPADIHIGGLGHVVGIGGALGGIVTHAIIWDYALSNDDALAVANQWL